MTKYIAYGLALAVFVQLVLTVALTQQRALQDTKLGQQPPPSFDANMSKPDDQSVEDEPEIHALKVSHQLP
jgi:hypothetical protein